MKTEKIPEALAAAYEKAARLGIELYYRKVAEEIVGSGKTGLLLDLGTGPGYLPIEIAKRSPETRIIGIDLSEKLIGIARGNAKKAGVSSQIVFEIGNAAGLRFRDASFDMVISTGMLHALKAPGKVLHEIYRLLKIGGSAWVFDPATISSRIDRKKWAASLSSRDRLFLWLFKTLGLHTPITPPTRNELVPIIEAAGFSNYSIEEAAGEVKILLEK
jgi:ubiquinone/menaquinone biosynthesis C-methylase UbiE